MLFNILFNIFEEYESSCKLRIETLKPLKNFLKNFKISYSFAKQKKALRVQSFPFHPLTNLFHQVISIFIVV